MSQVNQFYSTFKSNESKQEYQISELGKETFRTIGVMFSDGHGNHSGGEIINSPTTSKDYDNHFIKELIKLDPPYILEDFLDFHFNEYLERKEAERKLFLKHMKYVILDRVKKTNREPIVQLLTEWIAKNESNSENNTFNIDSDYFTKQDISIVKTKLDELLLRISRLELGQEITYDDLQDEMTELKELTTVLNKKTWFDVLKGKLVSIGLGKLTDQGVELITSIFSNDKALNQ